VVRGRAANPRLEGSRRQAEDTNQLPVLKTLACFFSMKVEILGEIFVSKFHCKKYNIKMQRLG